MRYGQDAKGRQREVVRFRTDPLTSAVEFDTGRNHLASVTERSVCSRSASRPTIKALPDRERRRCPIASTRALSAEDSSGVDSEPVWKPTETVPQ